MNSLTSILNAKPTNGAANERAGSSLIVFFSFLKDILGNIVTKLFDSHPNSSRARFSTSAGFGRYRLTESSKGWTPLFFKADPTKMGLNFRLITQRRIASLEEKRIQSDCLVLQLLRTWICFSLGTSSLRNISPSSSSTPEIVSIKRTKLRYSCGFLLRLYTD